MNRKTGSTEPSCNHNRPPASHEKTATLEGFDSSCREQHRSPESALNAVRTTCLELSAADDWPNGLSPKQRGIGCRKFRIRRNSTSKVRRRGQPRCRQSRRIDAEHPGLPGIDSSADPLVRFRRSTSVPVCLRALYLRDSRRSGQRAEDAPSVQRKADCSPAADGVRKSKNKTAAVDMTFVTRGHPEWECHAGQSDLDDRHNHE